MEKVRAYIERYHMISAEDHIIAGISGGADSVCLLCVLLDIRDRLGISLTAVHVNHGLRGEAADHDETFVRELCGKYSVPLEVFRVDLESISKNRKQSHEECGRNIRREAFEKVCIKRKGTKIALAHHQNDNAETLLWNLARGTGLTGLGGIRPVNERYIRPLLCLSRDEIEEFLKKRGQGYCTDDTNNYTEYTRNKLRHLVIPVLEKEVNFQSVRHMNEVMEQLREVQDYMEQRTAEALREYVRTEGSPGYFLITKELREKEPDILCTMVIRKVMELAAGEMRDMGRVHIRGVLDLFQKQSGRSLDLPLFIRAVRTYEGVALYRKPESKAEVLPAVSGRAEESLHAAGDGSPAVCRLSGEAAVSPPGRKDACRAAHSPPEGENPVCQLQIPGETRIPDMGLTIRCVIFPKTMCFSMEEIPQKVYTKWFDYDIIKKAPCIRTRQGGDQITIDQAGHRQKLKSWFINEKIPAGERESIPCIASGSDILWILGHRMSSAYQVTGRTERILQIEVVKEEN